MLSSRYKRKKAIAKEWTMVIKPKTGWFDINLKELWQYRDLIRLFVRRNYTTSYKQTILGPLWFIINPIITVLIYTVVFGNIAKISTDGMPQFLFYMAGNTLWTFFAYCINSTSVTFTNNTGLFGKVYFPRLTVPISAVIYGFVSLFIQLTLLIIFIVFYAVTGTVVRPNLYIFMTPLLIMMTAFLGLGFGIIITSLTTKYRDLTILVSFGVQLWMYATPIVYPYSKVSDHYKSIIMLNPMSSVIEAFRYAFLGSGSLKPNYLVYSGVVTILVLAFGIIIFSKVEKTFIDTV